MHRCQHSFKKIPSILWVVQVGYISFQEISYPGKPQVVSSYILSNLLNVAILNVVAPIYDRKFFITLALLGFYRTGLGWVGFRLIR